MKKMLMFLMVAIPILVICIVKLTATVTVGDIFIPIEYITLDQTDVSKQVGNEIDLTCSIFPSNASNKDIIWSSSDDKVASIDMQGHVKFLGIGSGYLTATSRVGGKSAQCSFYAWDTVVHQVELSAPQDFVHIDDTLQLSATVLPVEAENKDVSFQTSNQSIASVDSNGLVTGISEGNVTITVFTDDGNFSNSVDLLVVNPVKALKVASSEIVTSSNTVQLQYSIEPENATLKLVEFEVDNSQIASINHSGLLTFNKRGEVTVTLTTVDGNFSEKVKCIYTEGYAHELILETSVVNMSIDDAAYCIPYKTIPADLYSTKVEFSSNDDTVAFIDSTGYIRAVKGGSAVITVKVKSSKNVYIEKQIYVNVESPAREIVIEDGMTAEKSYQLSPKSLPEDSTNNNYFYHIDDQSKASVTPNGLVIFDCDQPCTVTVTIYANKDYSTVFKKVKVVYTVGKAGKFELIDKAVTMMFGQTITLNCQILPKNTTSKNMKLSVEEESPINPEGQVVSILEDGSIRAVGGGQAKIKVQYTLYDDSVVEDFCQITVLRKPSSVEIKLNLDFYKGQFVTSNNKVALTSNVWPLDSTEREITWSISDKNIAFINGNTLIFNQVGVVTLTAQAGEISNSVEVYYVGNNPVFAQANAIMDGKEIEIPKSIMVGERFKINISNIIPHYEKNPAMLIQLTNQKTANTSQPVLQIQENTVIGIAGGSATIVIYISNSIRLSFDIAVIRLPESITVLQENSIVTTDSVELVSQVLPRDTTNQNVTYMIENEDVASIDGSTLTFKKNGVAHIVAISQASSNIQHKFTIEKIEKNIVHIDPNIASHNVNKGDLLIFDSPSNYSLNIVKNLPIEEGKEVAAIEDKYLRCLCAGSVTIEVISAGKTFNIQIIVNQLVEDVIYTGNADFYNDEYVVGKDVIDLSFAVYPEFAVNQEFEISVISSLSQDELSKKIAYISGKQLYFTKSGSATLQLKSLDGNCTKIFTFNYTGGDAIDAQLNVGDVLVMNVGEKITIGVSKWLPFDVTNNRISFYEVNSTGKKIIEINEKNKTILALANGETKLVVELSSSIVKEIQIICVNKVCDIEVQNDDVLIAEDEYVISAQVSPKDATNKLLEYNLLPNEIASISGNVVHFDKPGTVSVVISTTDGSNIEKTIKITSTLNYFGKLVLSKEDISLAKGENFKILVDKFPENATKGQIKYKIMSQNPFDGKSSVISLSDEGEVVGLCSGSAVVRVFTTDYYGKEIFVDCNFTVISLLTSFDVDFDANLDEYQNQNTFITNKSEIPFTIIANPIDATINEVSYQIGDNNIAKIEDNKIIFLQKGRVTITFVCKDYSSTEKTKIYTLYYVGDDLIEATLDKSKIKNNNTITLNAGQSFTFNLERSLPSDIRNLNYTIKDVAESRIDTNKQVAKFENNTLYALNGGTYQFTLYVNDFKLDQLTLIVIRNATAIEVDGEDEIYISSPTYKISARVLETDSQQSLLGYKASSSICAVSDYGDVVFSECGICDVTIFVVDNPKIEKVIKIYYTKELKSVEFNKVRDSFYVGEYVDIFVTAKPADVELTDYTMETDNADIAYIAIVNGNYRLIGKSSGSVNVIVKVTGKNITASKQFTIYDKITSIKLELNSVSDANGHGGYRVFGINFFDQQNSTNLIKNYKMNATLDIMNGTSSSLPKDMLEWSTNDDSIATVDQDGLVTFKSTGRVTITVKQKAPYTGAKVAFDSYEFVVVNGINVYTYEQFVVANNLLTSQNANIESNLSAMVLHNDIYVELPYVNFVYSVYGNGYRLDHSKVLNSQTHFVIRKSGVVLDNVILRGIPFSDGNELLKLKGSGNNLLIENCKNVELYNTIIENAENATRLLSAEVYVEGCIFRNCLLGGMKIAKNPTAPSVVTIKDSVFTSSYGGVFIIPDTSPASAENIIKLEGDVRFYNWATLDQVFQGFDLDAIMQKVGVSVLKDLLYSQLQKLAKEKGTEYVFNYNGQTYYNFGLVQLSASIDLLNKKYIGTVTVQRANLAANCNYSDFKFSGSLNLGVVVRVESNILSLKPDNAFIRPGDSYLDDEQFLAKIKKPCRF